MRKFAVLLLVLAFGCATGGEKRRIEIGSAVNTYRSQIPVYNAGCQVVPHTRPDCEAFFKAMSDAYKAIQTANAASKLGPAPVQMAELARADKALKEFK